MSYTAEGLELTHHTWEQCPGGRRIQTTLYTGDIAVTIDVDAVARHMLTALRNRRGRAVGMKGAIVARASNVRIQPRPPELKPSAGPRRAGVLVAMDVPTNVQQDSATSAQPTGLAETVDDSGENHGSH